MINLKHKKMFKQRDSWEPERRSENVRKQVGGKNFCVICTCKHISNKGITEGKNQSAEETAYPLRALFFPDYTIKNQRSGHKKEYGKKEEGKEGRHKEASLN